MAGYNRGGDPTVSSAPPLPLGVSELPPGARVSNELARDLCGGGDGGSSAGPGGFPAPPPPPRPGAAPSPKPLAAPGPSPGLILVGDKNSGGQCLVSADDAVHHLRPVRRMPPASEPVPEPEAVYDEVSGMMQRGPVFRARKGRSDLGMAPRPAAVMSDGPPPIPVAARSALARHLAAAGRMKERGNRHFAKHAWSEAASAYRAALADLGELPPTEPAASALSLALHNNHAAALLRMQDWTAAADEANWALGIDPKCAKAHWRLGCAHEGIATDDARQRARENFERAVELDPSNRDVRYRLADLLKDAPPPLELTEDESARLRVVFVSDGRLDDAAAYSGTLRSVRQMVESMPGIDIIARVDCSVAIERELAYAMTSQECPKPARSWFDAMTRPRLLQAVGRHIDDALRGVDCDVIFCGDGNTALAAPRAMQRPVVWWNDCVWSLWPYYHLPPGVYKSLGATTVGRMREWDRKVLQRGAIGLLASEWGVEVAQAEHGPIKASRLKCVPYGPNVDVDKLPTAEEVERMIERRLGGGGGGGGSGGDADTGGDADADADDELRLLFMCSGGGGGGWEGKGGDLIELVGKILNNRGIRTKIIAMGDRPKIGKLPAYVEHLGSIYKGTEEGLAKWKHTLERCHFLVEPTKSDFYGICFVEACTYGLPSAARDAGGPGTIVKDGLSGKLFAWTAAADEWADWIERTWADKAAYAALARSARDQYEQRFNWDAAKAVVSEALWTAGRSHRARDAKMRMMHRLLLRERFGSSVAKKMLRIAAAR